MDAQRRKAVVLGVFGLALIVLGFKFVPPVLANLSRPYEDTEALLQLARTQAAQQPTRPAPTQAVTGETATPLPDLNGEPILLFFSLDQPCECMVELTRQAEQQMAGWPVECQDGVTVIRLAMDQHIDLQLKYQVFRAPCLVLLDAQGQIAWRQDYPLIDGGPFKLDELEAAIAGLDTQ